MIWRVLPTPAYYMIGLSQKHDDGMELDLTSYTLHTAVLFYKKLSKMCKNEQFLCLWSEEFYLGLHIIWSVLAKNMMMEWNSISRPTHSIGQYCSKRNDKKMYKKSMPIWSKEFYLFYMISLSQKHGWNGTRSYYKYWKLWNK